MSNAKPAARITDRTQHGGAIVTGSLSVTIEGLPAARLADAHVCPEHGGGLVVEVGTFPVSVALPSARKGDLVACPGGPHQIASGASRTSFGTNVHIGGLSFSPPGPDGGPAPSPPPAVPIPSGEPLRVLLYEAADALMLHPSVKKPVEEDTVGNKKSLRLGNSSTYLGNAKYLHDNPSEKPAEGVGSAYRQQKYFVGPLAAQASETQMLGTLNSVVNFGKAGKYSDILNLMGRFREVLTNEAGEKLADRFQDRAIAQGFEQYFENGTFPEFTSGTKNRIERGRRDLFARMVVLFNRETIRNPATAAYLPIMLRCISTGKMTWHDAFAAYEGTDTLGGSGHFPMSMAGAQAAAVRPRGPPEGSPKARENKEANRTEMDQRESALADPWVQDEVKKEMKARGIEAFHSPEQATELTRHVLKTKLDEFYNLKD